MAMLCVMAGALLLPAPVRAQTVIFTEDFENNPNNASNGAKSFSDTGAIYTGLNGQTYTASPDWLNGAYCNGIVLSTSNSSAPGWSLGNAKCSANNKSYDGVRNIARAIGDYLIQYEGRAAGTRDTNHILSSYSECLNGACNATDGIGSGATNGVMFRTATPLNVTANRFYGVSAIMASVQCATSVLPKPRFRWINGNNVAADVGGVLDVCGNSTLYSYTNLQTGSQFPNPININVKKIGPAQAIRNTTNKLTLILYNDEGRTNGNDGGFDNIVVTDITPSVSKSFASTSLSTGATTSLSFTIRNTPEKYAKPNWSFTDTLPSGMSLANATVVSDCTGVTTNAANNVTALTVSGSLDNGEESCTVTVTVKIAPNATGTLNNCGSNFTASAFILPPAATSCASVRVLPQLAVSKTSDPYWDPVNLTTNPKFIPGAYVNYTISVSNPGHNVSPGSVMVMDSLPSQVSLCVVATAQCSAPVVWNGGTSALTYTYTSLSSTSDDVAFSKDSVDWYYTPVALANGTDPLVRYIRVNPKGTMATTGAFSFILRALVK